MSTDHIILIVIFFGFMIPAVCFAASKGHIPPGHGD